MNLSPLLLKNRFLKKLHNIQQVIMTSYNSSYSAKTSIYKIIIHITHLIVDLSHTTWKHKTYSYNFKLLLLLLILESIFENWNCLINDIHIQILIYLIERSLNKIETGCGSFYFGLTPSPSCSFSINVILLEMNLFIIYRNVFIN